MPVKTHVKAGAVQTFSLTSIQSLSGTGNLSQTITVSQVNTATSSSSSS